MAENIRRRSTVSAHSFHHLFHVASICFAFVELRKISGNKFKYTSVLSARNVENSFWDNPQCKSQRVLTSNSDGPSRFLMVYQYSLWVHLVTDARDHSD